MHDMGSRIHYMVDLMGCDLLQVLDAYRGNGRQTICFAAVFIVFDTKGDFFGLVHWIVLI